MSGHDWKETPERGPQWWKCARCLSRCCYTGFWPRPPKHGIYVYVDGCEDGTSGPCDELTVRSILGS